MECWKNGYSKLPNLVPEIFTMKSRKSILSILILVSSCLPFMLLSNNPFTGIKNSTDTVSVNSNFEWVNQSSVLSETGTSHTNQYIAKSISDDDWLQIEDASPEISLEGRIPLLFIHGWSFSGRPSSPGTGYWEFFKNYLINDPELIKYFKPYYVKYWSNAVSVYELGGLLRNKVEQAGFSERPFVIIGHSMGGLVSRSFMNEYSFKTGINAGKKCGELVKLLITLGSPHHGSPMANGPARDDKVNVILKLTMKAVESIVFSDYKYSDVNRSDLRWDNYDGLLNYIKYPNERNDWLANLNTQTVYDDKLICYAGTVTGKLILSPSGTEEEYKDGSYLMKESFGFNNDGIVPFQSSSFQGHTPKKIRFFSEYNHADIVKGKGDGLELFNPLKEDLLEIVPPRIIWPTEAGIFVKHSQTRTISWDAPSSIKYVNIYFSGDNGQSYSILVNNFDASSGAFQWSVPDTNLTQCLIKITNSSYEDEFTISANPFAIYHNRLTILNPIVKSYFIPNQTNTISWQQDGIAPSVQLTYFDPKNNYETIIAEEYPVSQQANSFEWAIDKPIPPTDSAFIKIELLNMNKLVWDDEDYIFKSSPFMMLGEPEISVIAPSVYSKDEFGTEGEKLFIDSLYTIKFKTEGDIKYVRISLYDSSMNFISVIKTKNNLPGIHSVGSTKWRVPEFYGNKFYLLFEAGPNTNTINTTAFTTYPFRINLNTSITNPLKGDKSLSLLPCFKIDSVVKATNYHFEIADSATGGNDYKQTFNSPSPELCLPNTIKNELLPGVSYQLSVYAVLDTIKSYPSRVVFQTLKEKPLSFLTLLPVEGDTTEGIDHTFLWNRAVGTWEYQIDISNQKKLLFSDIVGRTDTSISVNLGKSGMPDTLFWKVTASNDYGKTVAESYFFKKNRTGFNIDALGQNDNFNLIIYPNPFETETTFEYILPVSTKTYQTEITIYNLSGQRIRTLTKYGIANGLQKVIWDGKDESGLYVEKGIYISSLKVDQLSVNRSIIVK
jgi:triacylglycerol esterase/lipase EstA (alpha/beta hydrolase family)